MVLCRANSTLQTCGLDDMIEPAAAVVRHIVQRARCATICTPMLRSLRGDAPAIWRGIGLPAPKVMQSDQNSGGRGLQSLTMVIEGDCFG